MLSLTRIQAIFLKELWQLSRDRITFAMIVMIPLVQLMLFGYAINTDVRHVPTALVDASGSSAARQLAADLQASQAIIFAGDFSDIQSATAAMTAGEINAILVIPDDFERRLDDRRRGFNDRPLAQWISDGSDPMLGNAIAALRQMPLPMLAPQHHEAAVPTGAMFDLVNYYNPERRSAVNIVPGLIAVILTMTMILFTSAAIVREREQGNMEFLINTPIRPIELMLGKILPYIAIGLIQVAIILGLGHTLFAVPLPVQWFSLWLVTLLFILASLTLGLLISTRAQTQLQAMQLTVFILLPSILLSGFMFPFVAMPKPAHYIAELLPATHYVRLVRAVVLRDAHWTVLTSDVLVLVAFTVIGMTLATLQFRKRLD
ncbi:MAG: ABC transporter permease [Gammaproteobacteria bacterium]|nr:ABC transporter permease [Gammaproteobacteria bacterium]